MEAGGLRVKAWEHRPPRSLGALCVCMPLTPRCAPLPTPPTCPPSFDMGAFLVATYIRDKLGKKTAKVLEAVGKSSGGVSGGTIASGERARVWGWA